MCLSQMDDEVIERNTLSTGAACWFNNNCPFGDTHVVVECASDSMIPKFLRVTLDTFWRARIDLCMHSLGATSNTSADLSKRSYLHVLSGGV